MADTRNYKLNPSDGWVMVDSSAAPFKLQSLYTPVKITFSSTAPAEDAPHLLLSSREIYVNDVANANCYVKAIQAGTTVAITD